MKARVTMRDVAQLAQVSLGTTSQALSNRPNVAPETRMRVLEAAAALGYQRQVRLDTPVTTKLTTVGMLTKLEAGESLAINPFYSHVLAGVERECQRQGMSLMYANIEVDEHSCALNWPPMLDEQRVDGILVVGTFLEDTILQISRQASQPIVLVDAYASGQPVDSILTDNVNGAYSAVKYLIEKGHRHIGLVGSMPDAYPSLRERRKGYTRALKHYGITEAYIEDGLPKREAVYEATLRLLRRAPEVTAIFACNDEMALGVISAAREMGRRVPADLSVIGFDDIDLAQEITPPLTTVHVDKTLMGVLAVRRLRERADHPEQAVTITLGTQLIIRQSVCAPAH